MDIEQSFFKADYRKYTLIPNTETAAGGWFLISLRNIRDDVKVGTRGGLVMSPSCLSHSGECWVYEGSIIFSTGRIDENALVYDNSTVGQGDQNYTGAPCVYINEDAVIKGSSKITGHITIRQKSEISNSKINGLRPGNGCTGGVINGSVNIHNSKIDINTIMSGTLHIDFSEYHKKNSGSVNISSDKYINGNAKILKPIDFQNLPKGIKARYKFEHSVIEDSFYLTINTKKSILNL